MPTESNMQVDPDVTLPAAVRAAAAKSAKIHEQITSGQPIDPMLIQDTPEGDFPDAITRPGNLEPPMPQEPAAQQVQELAQQPKPQEPSQEPSQDSNDESSWEHKYKSLHGRVRKQDEALKTLSEDNASLRAMLAALQASTPAPASEPIKVERLVTDEEVNEYGKDLLDVVGRRAREEVAPMLAERDQTIASLQAQLAGVNTSVQMSAKDKLLGELDTRLPAWRDMNHDEKFLSWLGLPDAYSGVIRHEMLKQAYAQGNANRVLAFFNGFLAEEAAVDPMGVQPGVRTETVQKVSLSTLAAPGKAKATATTPVAPVEKRQISRAEITKFYADSAAGLYRTREPERAKIEAEIFSAQREGRIV